MPSEEKSGNSEQSFTWVDHEYDSNLQPIDSKAAANLIEEAKRFKTNFANQLKDKGIPNNGPDYFREGNIFKILEHEIMELKKYIKTLEDENKKLKIFCESNPKPKPKSKPKKGKTTKKKPRSKSWGPKSTRFKKSSSSSNSS